MMWVRNNWYVITGTFCSGKTTLIKLLEEGGFRVVHEAARIYIDQEMAKGKTLEEIRQNEFLFQENVLKIKKEVEHGLPQDKIIFFDRGIPDTHAYYKLCGVDDEGVLNQAIKDCFYKKVFLLDRLRYKKDYARIETQEQQIQIHNFLQEAYQKLKVPLVKVPDMEDVQRRLEYILSML